MRGTSFVKNALQSRSGTCQGQEVCVCIRGVCHLCLCGLSPVSLLINKLEMNASGVLALRTAGSASLASPLELSISSLAWARLGPGSGGAATPDLRAPRFQSAVDYVATVKSTFSHEPALYRAFLSELNAFKRKECVRGATGA